MDMVKDSGAINATISWINAHGKTSSSMLASLNSDDLKADLLGGSDDEKGIDDSLVNMNAVAFAAKVKDGRSIDIVITDPATQEVENVTFDLSRGKVLRADKENRLPLILNVNTNLDDKGKTVELQLVAEEGKTFAIEMMSNDNVTLRARGYASGEFDDTEMNSKDTIKASKIKLAKKDVLSFNLGDLSLENAVEPFAVDLDAELN